jgi:hypothetical protein
LNNSRIELTSEEKRDIVTLIEQVKSLLSETRNKATQVRLFVTADVIGFTLISCPTKKVGSLIKLITENFDVTLIKQTPTTLTFAVVDNRENDELRDRTITYTDFVKGMNVLPFEALEVLADKMGWTFDIVDGVIRGVYKKEAK